MATLSPSSPLANPPTSTDTPPPPPESSTPAPQSPAQPDSNPPESSTVLSPPQPDDSTLAPQPPAQPDSNPPESSTDPSPPPPDNSPPPAPPPPLESTSPPPVSSPPPPIIPSPPPDTPPPPPTVAPPPSPLSSPPPVTPLPNSPPPSYISPPPPATNVPPVPSSPSNPPSPPPLLSTKSPPPPSPSHPTHRSPPPPPSKSDPPVGQPPPSPVSPKTTPPPPPRLPSPPHRPPSSPQSPESSPSSPAREPGASSPSKNRASSPLTQISPPPLSPSISSVISSADVGANSTASSPSKGGMSTGGTVAVGVAVGILMLGLIGLMVFYMNKRKRRTSIHNGGYIVPSPFGSSPRSDFNLIVKTESSTPFVRSASGSGTMSPHSHGGLGQSRSWFTYQELYEATKGFALANLLGEGGFGCVYKGVLANEKEVAVKQLKIGASQGEREFKAEVEIISRIHHRHLVSLVGFCIYESKRLLVYEYVPNQTLYYHLHGENRPVMDWATRIKIAEGSARGIAYLHEDCHPRIIHRDIKSSNILLDNKFEARVADFGLAKLALDVDTHISTRVMGTFGYMAPEYATSGKLTEKSDVYSFGVVLLELLTGRKPVDASQPLGDESLVEWARPLLGHTLDTGKLEGLVDPRLEKNYVESELFLMIEAAAACVRHSATKRPRMGQIVRAFDSLSPSDLSNGMRVGHSEIYDSAQQSAEIRWFRRMAFGSQDYSTEYFSEAARNNLNPKQNNQGPVFTTQRSQYDPSQQQSQNIYFSSHRTQGPVYSGESSLNVGSSNRQPEQFMDGQWTL